MSGATPTGGPGGAAALLVNHPVLRRLLALLASLLVASAVVFALINLLPGDLATVILGTEATPQAVQELRTELGLDRPLLVRYLEWLGGFVTLDLGSSAMTGLPIGPQIIDKLGVTLSLVLPSMMGAILIALPLGMYAALHRRRFRGFVASALSQVGMAIPAFLAGILLVIVFAVQWRLLPANGYSPLGRGVVGWARSLVLPVTSLAVVQGAMLTRYVRSAFVEVLGEDYLRTARAIGWTRRRAILRHGLRNASLSIITVLGLQLATLFVGAIVVENVFALPGLGSMLVGAVNQRDLILVQAIVMLLVALVLVINALVDLSYLALDPRLRRGSVVSEGGR